MSFGIKNFLEIFQTETFAQSGYFENTDWNRGALLGTGAYSTCYQARDRRTGTLMAVKKIAVNNNADPEENERILRLTQSEVELMKKLRHPHTIRMLGAVREGNTVNLFVEWMAGGSVASLLDKHGPFAELVITRFTFQTLLGLDYLHESGVLHRDIKGRVNYFKQ